MQMPGKARALIPVKELLSAALLTAVLYMPAVAFNGNARPLALSASSAEPSRGRLPMASTRDVVARMLERLRQDAKQDAEQNYGYKIDSQVDQLNADDSVKEHHEDVFDIVRLNGEPYDRLVLKDGKALSPKEQKKETKREEEFEHRDRTKTNDDDGELVIDERLLDRFQLELIGEQQLGGRAAWVLSLLPKHEQSAPRNMKERVLSKMEGKIWIDEGDASLVAGDLYLSEPVAIGGFLGTVREVHLQFNESQVAPDLWMPTHVHFYLNARALFKSIRVRQESQFSDYHRFDP